MDTTGPTHLPRVQPGIKSRCPVRTLTRGLSSGSELLQEDLEHAALPLPPGTAGARTRLRAPSGTCPWGPQRLGPPAPLGQRHPPSRRRPRHGRPGLTHGPPAPGPCLRGREGRHGPSTADPELRASAPVTPSNPSRPGCGPTALSLPRFLYPSPTVAYMGGLQGPFPFHMPRDIPRPRWASGEGAHPQLNLPVQAGTEGGAAVEAGGDQRAFWKHGNEAVCPGVSLSGHARPPRPVATLRTEKAPWAIPPTRGLIFGLRLRRSDLPVAVLWGNTREGGREDRGSEWSGIPVTNPNGPAGRWSVVLGASRQPPSMPWEPRSVPGRAGSLRGSGYLHLASPSVLSFPPSASLMS